MTTPTMRSNGDAHSGFKDEGGLICGTLTSRDGGPSAEEACAGHYLPTQKTGGGNLKSENQVGVRRLTPLECERLQGMPDGWTAEGIDEKGREIKMSDSARYFVCGNAVTANVAEWIGVGIKNLKP